MSFWNLLVFVLLCSCKQQPSENETTKDIESSLPMADLECIPGGEYISIEDTPTTGLDYAEICEPHLGIVPSFDCNDGVVIPIKVDGEKIWRDVDFYNCDDYSMQVGQCIPGSTVTRITGQEPSGS